MEPCGCTSKAEHEARTESGIACAGEPAAFKVVEMDFAAADERVVALFASTGDAETHANLSPEEQAIFEERNKQYGDATQSHANIGLAWTGILQNHFDITLPHAIPADVVLLMMATLKALRAARSYMIVPDNYTDAKTYFEMARTARKVVIP